MRILFGFLFLFAHSVLAEESASSDFDLKSDLKTTINYALEGSYKQFTTLPSFVILGVGAATTLYTLDHDKEWLKSAANNDVNESGLNFVSNLGVLVNTPIVPGLFYWQAKRTSDLKLKRFTQEYFATTLLAMGETVVISAIPFHERPTGKKLSPVETLFRGRSSFPSGHVIGYFAFAYKTFQFYGPLYSLAPLSLAVATSYQRVHDEKHFPSDVVAAAFVTLLASEGVRIASHYDQNHPLYKLIFEHDFKVGYLRNEDGGNGLVASWSY